jgi:hypothetical protein
MSLIMENKRGGEKGEKAEERMRKNRENVDISFK